MTTEPTDADIIALADKTRTGEPGREGYILPISFARAVLAKWGSPAQAAPCHCTNPWAHDQCTDSPGCKIKNKLTKASQPVAATAGMEPVATVLFSSTGWRTLVDALASLEDGTKLYTASQVHAMLAAAPITPAHRPLTDSQIADIYFEALGQHLREQDRKMVMRFARAIEQAHGIKATNQESNK